MKYNQHFPVAIALTKHHGWQAIYEASQCRGATCIPCNGTGREYDVVERGLVDCHLCG